MSNTANVFDKLDRSLDVGIVEFSNLTTNKIYTAIQEVEDTILGFNLGMLNQLKNIAGNIGRAINTLMNAPKKIMDAVMGMIQGIIDRIMGSPLLSFMRDIFSILDGLNSDGLRGFLAGELGMGNATLCNNLDVFQNMLNGIHVPPAIEDGLLSGLLLDWANRVCKPYTRSQESYATNKERMEMVAPYQGIESDKYTVIDDFEGISSGYLNTQIELTRMEFRMNDEEINTILKNGDIEAFKEKVGIHLTLTEKSMFLKKIDGLSPKKKTKSAKTLTVVPSMFSEESDSYGQGSRDNRSLLREFIRSTPVASREDIVKMTNHPKAKDALGSFLLNLRDFNLGDVPAHQLTDESLVILDKLYIIQEIARGPMFAGKTHASGQFENFDFSPIFEVFDSSDLWYLKSRPASPYCHRYQGLSPTTETFLENNVYYNKPKPEITAGA